MSWGSREQAATIHHSSLGTSRRGRSNEGVAGVPTKHIHPPTTVLLPPPPPTTTTSVNAIATERTLLALAAEGVQFEYPTATPRPYQLAGGRLSSVWYDRIGGMSPSNPEATASVVASVEKLDRLIDELCEVHRVPATNIIFGGFSMGGAIGIQTAARTRHKLGGVFALSSYLCDDSAAWPLIEAKAKAKGGAQAAAAAAAAEGGLGSGAVPVFMAHGTADDFVRPEWGRATAERLQRAGVPCEFMAIQRARHELTTTEVERLFAWAGEVLGVPRQGDRATAGSGGVGGGNGGGGAVCRYPELGGTLSDRGPW